MSNFSGTSNRGDLHEALSEAIENAKAGIQTDLIKWKLVALEGENGGFAQLHHLTATIDAVVWHKELQEQLEGEMNIQRTGLRSEPTDTEKEFATQYNRELEKLDKNLRLLAFRNVIQNGNRCGFAAGGALQYLLNTDSQHRYRVTVRTFWSSGIHSGTFDTVYNNEAGGKIDLGCSTGNVIPVGNYNRQVVGEVVI